MSNLGGFDELLSNDGMEAVQEIGVAYEDEDVTNILKDDDEDEDKDNDSSTNTNTNTNTDTDDGSSSTTGVYEYLKSKGITDPTNIKFEDEDGSIITRSFNELSADEQKNILNELSRSSYSDEESSFLSDIRSKGITPAQAMENYAKQYLEEYIKNNTPEPTYSIDDYTDEQLYTSDLAVKYPSLTEEQLNRKLALAKEDEELFKQEVNDLRTYYKQQEDAQREAASQKKAAEEEALQSQLKEAVNNFNGVYLDYTDEHSDSLEIEPQDKEDIYAYLTSQGPDGMSQLVKDLQNPDTLVELA